MSSCGPTSNGFGPVVVVDSHPNIPFSKIVEVQLFHVLAMTHGLFTWRFYLVDITPSRRLKGMQDSVYPHSEALPAPRLRAARTGPA